jgi:iron(II)-dependent oxidoreductase
LRELNDIHALSAALQDARDYTLALYAHLSPEQMQVPYLRTINPPLWEMAHVGWFQEFWCLRYRESKEPPPSRLENADPILNSAIIPHTARWNLPQLTPKTVHRYLKSVFDDTLEALQTSDEERRYFFKLALYHEDMHAEAVLMTLQTLGFAAPKNLRPVRHRPTPAPAPSEIEFAGGEFEMGSRPGPDFVFDNEKPAHRVRVSAFALSAITVTVGEYLAFVEASGYARPELWSKEGWGWRTQTNAAEPRYWKKDNGQWLARRFDAWEPLELDDPVMHVNANEAEAYCRFVGRRLPTEPEWEFAARTGVAPGADRFPWGEAGSRPGAVSLDGEYGRPVPAAALPSSDSRTGLRQMIGNVWNWTATPFGPYPGFSPDPYREYSQPWFNDHRVLRGGCFATRSRLVHSRWRNFYTPDRNDIFAGFRTASDRERLLKIA